MTIIYNGELKTFARENRNKGVLSEVILWHQLKGKQIEGFKFTKQKPILNYIVDFYCPKLKLVIEIDGSSHNDLDKDMLRDFNLKDIGITVLRFQDIDVKKNLEAVVNRITEVVQNLVAKHPK